jgi:CheY-like chemotaxis protein
MKKRQRDEGVLMAKILLVDDDEMSRDMLSRRLIRRGFEVIVAVDGKQGVEAARREKPDIVLMDMSLPVMDGWEATRSIKSDEATRGMWLAIVWAHPPVAALGCEAPQCAVVNPSSLVSRRCRRL